MIKELVIKARSFRKFDQADPVSEELLLKLVDIARMVPSAANLQPLSYITVCGKENTDKIFPLTAWAGYLKDWTGPSPQERPTGYIAILRSTKNNADIDVGIAAQTIQLAATEMGYGVCQLGSIKRESLRDFFGTPKDMKISLLIAIGKPTEKVVLEKVESKDQIKYFRTKDNIHHVPKRNLKDIIIKMFN
ncbi:MAG: nitroreductase family protein [Verrucomicrobiota bacterium]|nr:nitroreductase family protein [Verrucomicrobiota bacterium]